MGGIRHQSQVRLMHQCRRRQGRARRFRRHLGCGQRAQLPINGVSPNVIAHTTSIPITPAPCHYVTLSPSHPVTYHVRDPREESGMPWPDAFAAITKTNEPLAPYTHLKIGGPAEFFVQPTTVEELAAVLRHCETTKTRVRVLGAGVNLLVRDEPLKGAVLRLSGPAFTAISVNGRTVRAGCGVSLPAL